MTERDDNKIVADTSLSSRLGKVTRAAFAPGAVEKTEAAHQSRWHWLAVLFSSGNRVLPPRMAFVELAIFAIVILLEWQFDQFPDLTRINPHPYWIAVLLLSLQYGTVAGLASAGLAILGQVLIGLPEPDIEERYFNYLIRVWTQPVLWLLVALLLGAFRSRQIEKREFLKAQIIDLESRGATLVDYTANLEHRVATLERALAVASSPAQSRLLVALHALAEAKPGRWSAVLATVLDIAMPRAAVSVAAADERGLRVVITHNWPSDAVWRSEVPASDPLGRAILEERRTLSVAERSDEGVMLNDGVVAVPIFSPAPSATPAVIGMLKVERLDADLLDAATARRLTVIARSLAPAVAQGAVKFVAHEPDAAAPPTDTATSPAVQTPETTSIVRERVASLKRWRGLSWLSGGRDTGGPDGGKND